MSELENVNVGVGSAAAANSPSSSKLSGVSLLSNPLSWVCVGIHSLSKSISKLAPSLVVLPAQL